MDTRLHSHHLRICVQVRPGDRGVIARASGDYCTIIAQDVDKKRTKIRLPSGDLDLLPLSCFVSAVL